MDVVPDSGCSPGIAKLPAILSGTVAWVTMDPTLKRPGAHAGRSDQE